MGGVNQFKGCATHCTGIPVGLEYTRPEPGIPESPHELNEFDAPDLLLITR